MINWCKELRWFNWKWKQTEKTNRKKVFHDSVESDRQPTGSMHTESAIGVTRCRANCEHDSWTLDARNLQPNSPLPSVSVSLPLELAEWPTFSSTFSSTTIGIVGEREKPVHIGNEPSLGEWNLNLIVFPLSWHWWPSSVRSFTLSVRISLIHSICTNTPTQNQNEKKKTVRWMGYSARALTVAANSHANFHHHHHHDRRHRHHYIGKEVVVVGGDVNGGHPSVHSSSTWIKREFSQSQFGTPLEHKRRPGQCRSHVNRRHILHLHRPNKALSDSITVKPLIRISIICFCHHFALFRSARLSSLCTGFASLTDKLLRHVFFLFSSLFPPPLLPSPSLLFQLLPYFSVSTTSVSTSIQSIINWFSFFLSGHRLVARRRLAITFESSTHRLNWSLSTFRNLTKNRNRYSTFHSNSHINQILFIFWSYFDCCD